MTCPRSPQSQPGPHICLTTKVHYPPPPQQPDLRASPSCFPGTHMDSAHSSVLFRSGLLTCEQGFRSENRKEGLSRELLWTK